MNAEQGEMERKINVIKLADGLGFGEGTISVQDRLQSTEDSLDDNILRLIETGINSEHIITPVDVGNNGQQLKDDGCGDGRSAKRVFHRHDNGEIQEKNRSLHRSKVFGGGPTKTAAALVGLGKNSTKSVNGVFDEAITTLKMKEIPFGAHTDDHAHGENSGCGAIDKAPQIFSNAIKYENQIRETIGLIGIDTDSLDKVYNNFKNFADTIEGQSYSGSAVMDKVVDSGVIVKELEGSHEEVAIVLNTVEGHTVDQDFIRELSDGQAQVFATDIHRLEQIANELFDDPAEQKQALLSMVVYTLATAATLTKGDLPVYVVSKQPQFEAA